MGDGIPTKLQEALAVNPSQGGNKEPATVVSTPKDTESTTTPLEKLESTESGVAQHTSNGDAGDTADTGGTNSSEQGADPTEQQHAAVPTGVENVSVPSTASTLTDSDANASTEDGGTNETAASVGDGGSVPVINIADVPEFESEDDSDDDAVSTTTESDNTLSVLEDPRLRAHRNSLSTPYMGTNRQVERAAVDESQLSWATSFPEYNPPSYTAASVLAGPAWADKESPEDIQRIVYNAYDKANNVDRTSFEGVYKIVPEKNIPLNPRGRTGMVGRGLLGRYGPNHAADPVVSRWKMDPTTKQKFLRNGDPVLEFVAVKRRDTGEWALPGGMVDPGEELTEALKREFAEETLNSLEMEYVCCTCEHSRWHTWSVTTLEGCLWMSVWWCPT
eukprot:m.276157 g.276157  ORF g.276157 m.276157 type:complete len:391 (+) comp19764_c0_seq1:126-1298(+)